VKGFADVSFISWAREEEKEISRSQKIDFSCSSGDAERDNVWNRFLFVCEVEMESERLLG
jgi:hypothetical protein